MGRVGARVQERGRRSRLRRRLFTRGTRGTDRSRSVIVSQDYIIYDLPLQEWRRETGWAIKSIGEVASVVGGGTPDTEVPEYWSPGDVAWATPTDISATKGVYLSRTE